MNSSARKSFSVRANHSACKSKTTISARWLFWGLLLGKTTLAVSSHADQLRIVSFSAVLAGIKEIKEVMAIAEQKSRSGHRTIVFVDEVSSLQQGATDAFLPHVEAGHIIFIGATTENPFLRSHFSSALPHQSLRPRPLTTPQIAETSPPRPQ